MKLRKLAAVVVTGAFLTLAVPSFAQDGAAHYAGRHRLYHDAGKCLDRKIAEDPFKCVLPPTIE